jgi:hypothetical protein
MPFQGLRNSHESGANRRLVVGAALLSAGWFTVSAWCVYALCGLPSSLASQPRSAPAAALVVHRAGAGVAVALLDGDSVHRPCACDRSMR